MSTWFLCKATYNTKDEDGKHKKESELLLFDAVSPTEAEALLHKELGHNDDLEVTSITKTKYSEIINDESSKHWYSVKSDYINVDDKTFKELRLIRANSAQEVLNNFYSEYSNHNEVTHIDKTNILTVYNAKPNTDETHNS